MPLDIERLICQRSANSAKDGPSVPARSVGGTASAVPKNRPFFNRPTGDEALPNPHSSLQPPNQAAFPATGWAQ